LMSFAGVPPLLGFTNKFLIFITLFSKSNWIFLIFFGILNIFLIYFYIQNFRFLTPKRTYDKTIIFTSFLKSKKFIVSNSYVNYFNLFGILYIEDLLINFNSISSNMYL
jgi:NADH:ubiquinone oxidoreductase subunit 2 (subunit N)